MTQRTKVVTWQSPRGESRSVCLACEAQIRHRGEWLRDWTGEEYATVSHGLHVGACDVCQSKGAEAVRS